MQLKPDSALPSKNSQSRTPKRIRESLAIATCSLLATSPQTSNAEEYQAPWEIDTSLLIYEEKDRVSAIKPMLGLRKEIGDDEYLNLRIVADALTGASPNGAAPADTPQTFTSPSGRRSYTTPANEMPLDTTFKDTRGGVTVEWEKPVTETLNRIFGFNLSIERDYASLGVSGTFNKDLNQRHTTLTFAASTNMDAIKPTGNAPVGFSVMPPPGSSGDDDNGDTKTKNVTEVLFGVTQVINRFTLTQLNYSMGSSSGYLNDPYKLISVLDLNGSGDLRATDPYVYEKRPDKRTHQSIFWKGVHQLPNEDVINVSYRYFWDDWDIKSHTMDLRYRWEVGDGHYLQPHLRYYTQTAAKFYRQTLIDGEEATLSFASADYRLGEFTTQTIGLKYGILFDSGAEFNIRVETMQQRGKTINSDAIGKLQNVDLYPDMDASIVQAGISLDTDIFSKFIRRLFGKD